MVAPTQKERLADFFRSEYRKLLGFVRRRIDDIAAQDAEDFVHDVAIHMFDRADLTYPIENLSAYIYKALHNRIADYVRRRRSKLPLDWLEPDQEVSSRAGNNEERDYDSDSEIRRMQITHDLHRLLDGLNEDEKKLIIATEIEGQTFSRLSKIWNVPINTLLSRKSRAFSKIRHQIQKEQHAKEQNHEQH